MLDWSEILLRLGIAALAGGALGLNRDLHGKPVGLRTLSLVSLATAMVMVLADPLRDGGFTDAGSRIVQGILTGIGFLGAGVIFHAEKHFRIHGLTSAACTWLTACIGIMCGAGQWRIVAVALAITFVVLLVGGPVERRLHRVLGGKPDRDLPLPLPAADQSSEAGPHQPGR
ncbi:MgtC/SapB family protein [Tardiphaga sp.]|uniref:MgtC/SapB family protein n=1 Tax=Tardiphaga sp. TaxID=1926292 RepID=UPI00260449BA|nr:MgtC/SapB family protein [Tardiphaga sp.]MDB5619655.1 magnesium transporter [Tardiphaga sp.]